MILIWITRRRWSLSSSNHPQSDIGLREALWTEDIEVAGLRSDAVNARSYSIMIHILEVLVTDRHALDDLVLLQTVHTAFTTVAALLDTTEWRFRC